MTGPDIRAARPGELEQVGALWLEASRWLAGRGLDQWQYPPRRWRMAEAIEAGDCYLAFRALHVHENAIGTPYAAPRPRPAYLASRTFTPVPREGGG
ncbi:hypothetical protein ACIP4Y_03085 [Streptomyces sp. NPDC088810]|uniref:hypothetical protein n=1 Tax=unclassified Streptomyces TaxID=2593676 RepID=UPI00381B6286